MYLNVYENPWIPNTIHAIFMISMFSVFILSFLYHYSFELLPSSKTIQQKCYDVKKIFLKKNLLLRNDLKAHSHKDFLGWQKIVLEPRWLDFVTILIASSEI